MPRPARDSQQHFTYADYCTWPNDQRWELIDGRAWDMSPAPSRHHRDIVLELGLQIKTTLRGQPCAVYIAPFDVRLAEKDEADNEIPLLIRLTHNLALQAGSLDGSNRDGRARGKSGQRCVCRDPGASETRGPDRIGG
jgi:hypothetical protein